VAGFQDVLMQLLRCSEGFLTCCYALAWMLWVVARVWVAFAKGRVILAIAMELQRFCGRFTGRYYELEDVWSGF